MVIKSRALDVMVMWWYRNKSFRSYSWDCTHPVMSMNLPSHTAMCILRENLTKINNVMTLIKIQSSQFIMTLIYMTLHL